MRAMRQSDWSTGYHIPGYGKHPAPPPWMLQCPWNLMALNNHIKVPWEHTTLTRGSSGRSPQRTPSPRVGCGLTTPRGRHHSQGERPACSAEVRHGQSCTRHRHLKQPSQSSENKARICNLPAPWPPPATARDITQLPKSPDVSVQSPVRGCALPASMHSNLLTGLCDLIAHHRGTTATPMLPPPPILACWTSSWTAAKHSLNVPKNIHSLPG